MTGLQVWLHPSSRTIKQVLGSQFSANPGPSVLALLRTENLELRTAFYTLRRFGGRHPLCGMGVTSRIERTSIPEDASARTADSRPEPGPLTRTSTLRTP